MSFAYSNNLKKQKMKSLIFMAFIVLITSAKAQDTINNMSGPHGGLLKKVGNYKIETINSYGCITAYLFDGSLKLIPNKIISGTILFFYGNGASLNNQSNATLTRRVFNQF